MLTKLTGGTLYDPANAIEGKVSDIYIRDGRIVSTPPASEPVHRSYALDGKIVMAGAIDLHTHIGGGKVNIARTMLPEDHREHVRRSTTLTRSGSGHALNPGSGIPLRGNGLYQLLRTRHPTGQRPPGPHGNGGHSHDRYRRLCHAG